MVDLNSSGEADQFLPLAVLFRRLIFLASSGLHDGFELTSRQRIVAIAIKYLEVELDDS